MERENCCVLLDRFQRCWLRRPFCNPFGPACAACPRQVKVALGCFGNDVSDQSLFFHSFAPDVPVLRCSYYGDAIGQQNGEAEENHRAWHLFYGRGVNDFEVGIISYNTVCYGDFELILGHFYPVGLY